MSPLPPSPYEAAREAAITTEGPVLIRCVCRQCSTVVATVRRAGRHLLYEAELVDPELSRVARESLRVPVRIAGIEERTPDVVMRSLVLLDWPISDRTDGVPKARCGCGDLRIDEGQLVATTRERPKRGKVHRIAVLPL